MSKHNSPSCFRKGFLLSPLDKKTPKNRRNASVPQPLASQRPAPSSALLDLEEKKKCNIHMCSIFKSNLASDIIPASIESLNLDDESQQTDIAVTESTHQIRTTSDSLSKVTSRSFNDERTTLLDVEPLSVLDVDPPSANERLSLTHASTVNKEFAHLIWSLRKVPKASQVIQHFIESYLVTYSHWRYAWMLLLDKLAQDDRESPLLVEIGYEMMTSYGLGIPATFLVLTEGKNSRVSALGAASFFEKVARKCRSESNIVTLRELLNLVYPSVLQIAIGCGATRSRLSHQAVMAASAIVIVSSEVTSIRSEFIQVLPGMDRLLEIQQLWIQSSLASNEKGSQTARKQCSLAVITDWRNVWENSTTNEILCNANHFGGLYQILCPDPTTMTPKDMVASLSQIKDYASSRYFARGLAAWLGNSGKHLKQFQQATESPLVIAHLIESLKDGPPDLTLNILNYIWYESEGLPQEKGIEATFLLLVDVAMKRETSNVGVNALDTGTLPICTMIATFVIDGGPTRFDEFVSLAGEHPIAWEVLSHLTSALDKLVAEMAASNLLRNLSCSASLRHKTTTTKELFQSLSTEFLVPKIIDVACILSDDLMTPEIATKDTLSIVMWQRLQSSVSGNAICSFMQSFVIKLLTIEGVNETMALTISAMFAPRWRQVLILNHEAYGSVLNAISSSFLNAPSSVSILALLGSFVGIPADYDFDSSREIQSILFGLQSIVQLCADHLQDANKCDVSNLELFKRLSPLLLLRRIPSRLYQVAWKCLFSNDHLDRKNAVFALSSLAHEMVIRLAFNESPTDLAVSPEERRLAAEVAGHSLPFDSDELCSCFHIICRPAFSNALNCASSNSSALIKSAKAALYAVVYSLSVSANIENIDGILATVAFALLVCNLPEPSGIENPDLGQLRKGGCTELFAICFEQVFAYKRVALAEVAAYLRLVLTEDDPDLQWLHDISLRLFHVDRQVTATPNLRNYLWNAVLEVSKRCPEQDGLLEHWARSILPWVIERATMVASKDANHPLCAANALQVVFVLIVRTKSLEYVSGEVSGWPMVVPRIYKWALRSIEYPPQTHGALAMTLVKTAGLKLLVAILLIDQTRSNGVRVLGSMELTQVVDVLRAAAMSVDEPEVQHLAAQVMQTLKF